VPVTRPRKPVSKCGHVGRVHGGRLLGDVFFFTALLVWMGRMTPRDPSPSLDLVPDPSSSAGPLTEGVITLHPTPRHLSPRPRRKWPPPRWASQWSSPLGDGQSPYLDGAAVASPPCALRGAYIASDELATRWDPEPTRRTPLSARRPRQSR